MTKEELRQEAEAEADKVIIGSGMDRTSVIHLKHLLVTMYIQGATKVTVENELKDRLNEEIELHQHAEDYIKSLEAQIEKMKCCGNCKNFNNFRVHCELDVTHSVECHCNNYKLWEIKENEYRRNER